MKKTHIQGSNIEKFCSNAAAGRRALKNLDPTPPPAAGLSKIWLRRRRRPPGSQKFGSDAAAGRRALKNLAPTPPPAAGSFKKFDSKPPTPAFTPEDIGTRVPISSGVNAGVGGLEPHF